MKKTKGEQIEAKTAESTEPQALTARTAKPPTTEFPSVHARVDHGEPSPGNTITAPSADPPVSGEPPSAEPAEIASEWIAQTAYAKVAEELKFKGDFPEWDQVSERGRALYFEGAAHVQNGGAPRTRFEEIVAEVLHG